MGKPDLTEEELKRLLEEQKKKVEAMLAAMTPEERADAEKKFAAMRKTLGAARKGTEVSTAQEHHTVPYPGAYVPDGARSDAEKPVRFCQNCGAQAGDGKFCEYCGSPLK